jgi:hypothetical protein
MVAGVDPIGPMDDQSAHETTNSKVEILRVRVLMLLIVLVVSMTEAVPVLVDALVKRIEN